jgi:hypothetical protein
MYIIYFLSQSSYVFLFFLHIVCSAAATVALSHPTIPKKNVTTTTTTTTTIIIKINSSTPPPLYF